MVKTYLSDEEIYLRAVEPEDLELLYHIENDPLLWDIGSFTVPYSRYNLKQYIEDSLNDVFSDKQLRLMIVRKFDNKPLGTIDVTDFVPLHSRGAVGIALLAEYRHKGYGKAALDLLCTYVFDFLRLKQLYAQIPADNEISIALFVSCGFQQCGLLKHWLQVGGDYKDVVMMQLVQ